MKNNAYIGIPLTDTAVAVLLDLQKVRSVTDHVFHDDGHPLYYVKIQRALKKALIAAEIEDFHFHDLRHTFASMLVQSGTELYTAAKDFLVRKMVEWRKGMRIFRRNFWRRRSGT